MTLGIGTDIVEISRLEKVVARTGEKFAERILTDVEMAQYNATRMPVRLLAKRFAAKEAASKALGTGIGRGISWHDFQIDHNEDGAPLLKVTGGAKIKMASLGASQMLISISDEQEYAVAFVVLL